MTDTPGSSLEINAEQVWDERSLYHNPCCPNAIVCVMDMSELGKTKSCVWCYVWCAQFPYTCRGPKHVPCFSDKRFKAGRECTFTSMPDMADTVLRGLALKSVAVCGLSHGYVLLTLSMTAVSDQHSNDAWQTEMAECCGGSYHIRSIS